MVDMFPAELLERLNISLDSLLFATNGTGENETLTDFSGLSDSDEVKYEKTLFNHYLMGIGGTTVCFVGIICNILSVIVLTRRVMNSSTYSYLSALAVCDTIALTLTVTLFLLSTDIQFPKKGEIVWASDVYAYLFPYLHPSAMAMQVTSIWLTLGFTVDRYIMICHPFRAESMCNVKRARMVIVLIYVLGILFSIPRFLEYKSKKVTIPSLTGDIQKRVLIMFTDIGENKLYIDLMHSYLYITFVCGIPFLTMSILNIFLMHAVHLSRQRGKQINIKEKKRNDTTIMLIGVIIIFLACQGPALISRMVYAINRRMATSSLTFHKINEVGNFLIIVNSAINIVPYYFFGKRFRREFWRLFCKCVLSGHELRKMTRSLSFSVEHRRKSVISNGSQYELNGFLQPGATGLVHRDSNSPLLQHIQNDHKDSMIPYLNTNHADRTPSPCFSDGKNENGQAGQPLKVIWEMDDNKNEKYNVKVHLSDPVGESGQL